jgi:hypothetical protein
MASATIKLFLPHGDAKRLRVCEVSNWTGKALAAPRTELDDLLAREEAENCGVYFLFGSDPELGELLVYIGEAEVVRDRLKQHRARDWNWAVVFVSKDENLTKAHIRYLENRILQEAKKVGRYRLENANASSPKLTWRSFFRECNKSFPYLARTFLRPSLGRTKLPNLKGDFSAKSRMSLDAEGEPKVDLWFSKTQRQLVQRDPQPRPNTLISCA